MKQAKPEPRTGEQGDDDGDDPQIALLLGKHSKRLDGAGARAQNVAPWTVGQFDWPGCQSDPRRGDFTGSST